MHPVDSSDLLWMALGLLIGWLSRGKLQSWIVRHAVSQGTRDAMDRDIEQTVDRWFHRQPKTGSKAGK